ncbi:MAG: transcriptional repressor LexA [Spirochaetes bacterium]|nr:transcriptional repressor LexA [Spirochaetota bacterium]NLJ04537.1 transcriptional repressor LexA [Exilispira sp.]MBP8991675.1 transcriptional repressor LexA [Spirochaetota bacterium]HOV46660.1 transcriptional repressor LexA [Exilispira sp.]HQM89021.1 transcriptional repressor LexA [Exilispira sp.]
MENITRRQKEILLYINDFIEQNQYAPSIYDIANAFSINTKTAQEFVERLVIKGYLTKEKKIARTIQLTEKAVDELTQRSIPILGATAAGKPIEVVEDIKGQIVIDKKRFSDGEFFALVVRGDSMKEAGILDGDFVIVKRTELPRDGDIVVALIDEEVTLKRLFYDYQNHQIILHPENNQLKDTYINPDSFKCAGIVVGVQRYFD